MLALKCAVCEAKKGEANKWWVLFQADSNQAALIAPMEKLKPCSNGENKQLHFIYVAKSAYIEN